MVAALDFDLFVLDFDLFVLDLDLFVLDLYLFIMAVQVELISLLGLSINIKMYLWVVSLCMVTLSSFHLVTLFFMIGNEFYLDFVYYL